MSSCLTCLYNARTIGPIPCAVNPFFNRRQTACQYFEPMSLRQPERWTATIEVKKEGKWSSYDLHLVAIETIILVRGFSWENFRFNTESVEFISPDRLGFSYDPVPSSLSRQTERELPTLREFLEERHHNAEKIRISGVPVPVPKVEPPVVKRSQEETIELFFYWHPPFEDGQEETELTECGSIDCPRSHVTTISQMWEMQSEGNIACSVKDFEFEEVEV